MRLKILVVPFSILSSLVVVIGYVKPDITVLQDTQVLLDTKTSQSESMTTLLGNIDALSTSLEQQPASQKLVDTYVPKMMDQERIIDMFNYLASQSGVSVSVMNMTEILLKQDIGEMSAPSASVPLVVGSENVMPVAPVVVSSFKPQVATYAAEVEVKGSYDGIKDFYNRISHMNRFHKVLYFSLEAATSDSPEAESGILTGHFQSRFDYFPLQPVESALGIPVFLQQSFDNAELSALSSWVNYTVPPLMIPDTGRPNPFRP